jgi:hypothetical protein
MAGIYGIWQFGNSDSIEGKATILYEGASYANTLPRVEMSTVDGTVLFGCAQAPLYSASIWPQTSRDGNFLFSIQGEAFLASGAPISEQNWESEFLPKFRSSPSETLLTLDGAFELVLYDARKQQLILASDRFGNFALHYTDTKEYFAFGTQMHGLAKLRKAQLEDSGIAQFIGLGYTMNGTTQYSGVKRLPAASILTRTNEGTSIVEYYRPRFTQQANPSKQTLGNWGDEFAEIFRESVARRIQRKNESERPVAAALSGGYDSRLTWSAIQNIGATKTVNAFTLGLPNSRDLQISRRIAERLGIRQLPHIFDRTFLQETPDFWEKTVAMTEGGLGIESSTTVQTWHRQKDQYSVLLDSFGGALYRRQYMRLKARKFLPNDRYGERMFDLNATVLPNSPLINEEFRTAARKESADALEQFFEEYKNVGTIGDQLDLYYITQISTNRNALSNNAQLNFLGLHYPLLNNHAYNLVQQVPASLRKRNWIHAEVIHRLAPALEKFPIDNQGMWGPYRGFSYLRYPGMGYEVFLRKLSKVWGTRLSQMLSMHRPLTDHELIVRLNIERFESELRDAREVLLPYADWEQVEQSLLSFKEYPDHLKASRHFAELQQLLSFGLWLKSTRM